MGRRVRVLFAILACFFACGDIILYPAPAYAEEELGNVVIQVMGASGLPASGVRVYWGDDEAVYEGFEVTDSAGRAELGALHGAEGRTYYFFTFLDGYFVERAYENIEAGKTNVVEIRPDSANMQVISIETFGNGTFYPGGAIDYRITIRNCSGGDSSYVEILAYEGNGELIRALCSDPEGYGFDFTGYGRGFPWLGYGYDTGKLTKTQREWLLGHSGELCLGDLQEIWGRCTYPSYHNPMEQRIAGEYRPECPHGRTYHEVRGKIEYAGGTELPKNAERVVIRAVGIDGNGNYKIVNETLVLEPDVREFAAPCWLCATPSLLAMAMAGLCAISCLWPLRALSAKLQKNRLV